MSSASQFLGRRATKAIHAQSTLTATPWVNYSPSSDAPAVAPAGSVTANVYKTLLSVSGVGDLSLLYLRTVNAADGRAISVRLTVDGVILYNGSTSNVGTLNSLIFATRATPPIFFNSSLLFELASNYTEGEFCQLFYSMHTY